jgi:hypothetical protein
MCWASGNGVSPSGVWRGLARHGRAWQGGAWHGMAWAADSSTEPLRRFPAALIREQTGQDTTRQDTAMPGLV